MTDTTTPDRCMKLPKLSKLEGAAFRVQLAKDVLLQIKIGQYTPTEVAYFEPEVKGLDSFTNEHAEPFFKVGTPIRDEILPKVTNCGVCGVGSLFVSLVRLKNKCDLALDVYTTGGFNNQQQVFKKLGKYFSRKELATIETAFMGDDYFPSYMKVSKKFKARVQLWTDNVYTKWLDRGRLAGDTVTFQEYKLVSIMKNIIDHKGKFKP